MAPTVTQRISDVADEAMTAFWAVVAERFPEAKTGDFSPTAQFAFEYSCEMAIRKWLYSNAESLMAFEESSETNR